MRAVPTPRCIDRALLPTPTKPTSVESRAETPIVFGRLCAVGHLALVVRAVLALTTLAPTVLHPAGVILAEGLRLLRPACAMTLFALVLLAQAAVRCLGELFEAVILAAGVEVAIWFAVLQRFPTA